MKKYILSFLLPLMAVALAFTSCSESSNDTEEFPNWQQTNDSYFDKLYADTKAKIDQGDTSWKIIRGITDKKQRWSFVLSKRLINHRIREHI